MPPIIRRYVDIVDKVNRRIGRMTMYLIFVLMGILFYSSFSKAFLLPSQWTLEMAQFVMVAFYLLGGPYSIQMGDHVRMDLLYENWSPRRKAAVDSVTVLFLIFYTGMLLYGGFSSTSYSIQYGEQSYSSWAPYMWPIKVLMCFAIFMMLLQAIAEFFKNLATARGEDLT